MDSIFLPLILSFISGALGYIIVRFWIIPITRYRRTREALLSELKRFDRKLSHGHSTDQRLPGKKHLKDIRQLNKRLVEIHTLEVPHWYRLLLMTRGESPESASAAIEHLQSISDVSEARQRLDEIGRHLRAAL